MKLRRRDLLQELRIRKILLQDRVAGLEEEVLVVQLTLLRIAAREMITEVLREYILALDLVGQEGDKWDIKVFER